MPYSKKVLFFLLIFFFAAASQVAAAGMPRAVAVFYPLYIHALNVAGDRFEVDVLLPPGAAIHDFAPKPSDISKIAAAAVVIKNGAGLDDFVDKMAKGSGGAAAIVDSSYGVELIDGGCDCARKESGDSHAEAAHAAAHSADPHTWLSLENAVAQVANIAEGLSKADPKNAAYYGENARAYSEKLRTLKKNAASRLAPFRGRKFMVYHGPFSYFAREFGLVQYSIADSAGNAPSPSKIAAVYDTIKKDRITFLVSEPAYQNRQVQSLAEELGLAVIELDPVESYPSGTSPGADYFIDRMKTNIEKLAAAFEK